MNWCCKEFIISCCGVCQVSGAPFLMVKMNMCMLHSLHLKHDQHYYHWRIINLGEHVLYDFQVAAVVSLMQNSLRLQFEELL